MHNPYQLTNRTTRLLLATSFDFRNYSQSVEVEIQPAVLQVFTYFDEALAKAPLYKHAKLAREFGLDQCLALLNSDLWLPPKTFLLLIKNIDPLCLKHS